jgi:hypothetical protein
MSRFRQVIGRFEPLDAFFVCAIVLMGSVCIWLAVR